MTTKPHIIRDQALEEAKANYLIEMKELRREYAISRDKAVNVYNLADSITWRRYWEDVG